MLVDHLFNLGHKKIAWLGGNKNLGRQIERFEGVEDALRERNLSINPKHIARSEGGDRMEGYKAAKHIVEGSKNDLTTAWICLNGLMAREAYQLSFPKQLQGRTGCQYSGYRYDRRMH